MPISHRGNGYGSELLDRILADADAEDVILRLNIDPYGDMTFDQLREWYGRNGFKRVRFADEPDTFARVPEGR